MKIRGTDGQAREERAGYVLKDGEAVIVSMAMMDSMQRAIASEQELQDAIQRSEDAYQKCRDDLGNAWMTNPSEAPARPDDNNLFDRFREGELTLDELRAQAGEISDAAYRRSVDALAGRTAA